MRLDLESGSESDDAINMMPLVDVVFLLLIFFLAATTFANEEVELALKLPDARAGESAEPVQRLVVNVFADGRLVVDGREVTLEALRQKLAAAARRNSDQSVLVRGDRAAQFGVGIAVLDACKLAKITKVDFGALPERGN
ncbi:MAG: biopolymer transporter ExbD [Planctomycetes bacterium]|nr:biopolymer transporter ExbD [Planctomycetota bacterium]